MSTAPTTLTTFDLRSVTGGRPWLIGEEVDIRVRAVGDLVNYLNSEPSVPIRHTFADEEMPQLATPTLSINGSVISWTAVPNAEWYGVYINGMRVTTRSSEPTSYNLALLSLLVGEQVQVQVRAGGDWTRFNPSELSNAVNFTFDGTLPERLATPVASINGAVVSWNAVPNARNYWVNVLKDGNFVFGGSVLGTSVDLRVLARNE